MKILEITKPATLEDASLIHRTVRYELGVLRIHEELINDIQLAVAELTSNAIIHAALAPSFLSFQIDLVGAELRLQLTDDGAPFRDFDERWDAAANTDLAGFDSSGRGLALAWTTIQRMTYSPGPPNVLVGWRSLIRRRPAILLVEDDPVLLDLYRHILKDKYRVFPADSIAIATLIASSRAIDLIVTDYHIGEETAPQLISALDFNLGHLPVPTIVLSADHSLPTRAAVVGLGSEQFITKPTRPKELRQAVDRALIASQRRLTRMFRYFGARSEHLIAAPHANMLARAGVAMTGTGGASRGGDLVLVLDGNDRQRIVIADIMGHGLSATSGAITFAAVVRTLNGARRVNAIEDLSANAFLGELSAILHRDSILGDQIVTILVADRLHDGSLEFSSAGHPLPVLVEHNKLLPLGANGPLPGLFATAEFPILSIKLRPGQRIVAVTDGIDPNIVAVGGDLPRGLAHSVQDTLEHPLTAAITSVADWAAQEIGPDPQDDWTVLLFDAV